MDWTSILVAFAVGWIGADVVLSFLGKRDGGSVKMQMLPLVCLIVALIRLNQNM